jgi:methylmalonyl-CoA mutase cobalamin-binding subunit
MCLKSSVNGTRKQTKQKIQRTAAIQERVTAVLRSIPNEAFADSFQKLYELCQPCVVKADDYFEGQ